MAGKSLDIYIYHVRADSVFIYELGYFVRQDTGFDIPP
jgi:hypothetical protein